MNTNKFFIATGLVSVLVAAGWYTQHTTLAKVKKTERAVSSFETKTNSKAAAVYTTVAAEIKTNAESIRPREVVELSKHLMQIKLIQKKVFKNDAELTVVKSFINSRQRLQSLAALLTRREALIEANSADHSNAVDVLIAASQSGDSQYAEELILEIIRDGKIENENEHPTVRQNLAGIKAELMYHAVRIDNRTVQNSISGPATQKIWDNVQQAQADNVTESQLERRAQIAQQSR